MKRSQERRDLHTEDKWHKANPEAYEQKESCGDQLIDEPGFAMPVILKLTGKRKKCA